MSPNDKKDEIDPELLAILGCAVVGLLAFAGLVYLVSLYWQYFLAAFAFVLITGGCVYMQVREIRKKRQVVEQEAAEKRNREEAERIRQARWEEEREESRRRAAEAEVALERVREVIRRGLRVMEEQGVDVCLNLDCLTIKPERCCNCGRCLKCYGGYCGYCSACYS